MSELVKTTAKTIGISITHVMGHCGCGPGSAVNLVNQTLGSILDLAVQMSALNKIGDTTGMNRGEIVAAPQSKSTSDDLAADAHRT